MRIYVDARTKLVLETGFARGVPKHICKKAHRMMHLLRAASGWQDVNVAGVVRRVRGSEQRYGLNVEGKWYVTFDWDETLGLREVLLERR
jgi:plasmid maintenance system killer protein